MVDGKEVKVRIVKIDHPFGKSDETLGQKGFTLGQVIDAYVITSIRGDVLLFNHISPDGENCAMEPCEVEIVEE